MAARVAALEAQLAAQSAALAETAAALQAERARRTKSEAKFDTVFNASPNLMAISAIEDGRLIDANEGLLQTLGYARHEVIGKTSLELGVYATPEDRERIVRHLRENGRVKGLEFPIVTRDGSRRQGLYFAEKIELEGEPLLLSVLVDVTERKLADVALRAAQEQLKATLDAVPDVLFEVDADGRIFDHRAPAHEHNSLPHAPAAFMGRTIRDVLPADACEVIAAAIAEAGRQGWHRGGTYALPIGGEPRWFELSISRRAGGAGDRFVLLARNITIRKLAEERLQEREALLRVVIDNAPVEFWVRDTDGVCIMHNSAVLAHWGSLLGQRPDDTKMSPENRAVWLANNRRAYGGEVVQEEVAYVIHGQTRYYYNVVAPFRVQGEIRGILGFNLDITERRRVEEALRQSEASLQLQIRRMPIAYILWTSEFLVQAWNPAATRIFGYREEEALGRHAYDLIVAPPDQTLVKTVFQRLLQGDATANSINENVTRDGRTILCEWSNTPIQGPGGKVTAILSMVQDVTARQQAEEALQKAHADLEQKVKARTAQLRQLAAQLVQAEERERQRIARILHEDLQQMIAGARFTLSSLKHRLPAGERDRVLAEVSDILGKASQVTRAISVDLRPPVLHEGSLGAALIWLAADMKERHGLDVRVQAMPGQEPTSPDLRVFIFQAVRELLFNVCKHAGVSVADVRTAAVEGGQFRIDVCDHGVGFDVARSLPRSFGLFSIRERAEFFGGALVITSSPGHGTQTSLILPAV